MNYDWPDTPDVAPAVLERIGRRPRRWPLFAVVLALLVPAGVATALILGIDSARVRVGTPPPALPTPSPGVAGFEPILPPRLGTPDRIRERDGQYVLKYDGGLTLTEIAGATLDRPLVEKVVSQEGAAREVPGGLFVKGGHFVAYLDADGFVVGGETAQSTLLVERGDILLRLEGRGLTLERAQRLLG